MKMTMTRKKIMTMMKTSLQQKVFLYIEETDGGMRVHVVTELLTLATLPGWMDARQQIEDMTLVRWMKAAAEVGDVMHHRCGIVIRVKDAMH